MKITRLFSVDVVYGEFPTVDYIAIKYNDEIIAKSTRIPKAVIVTLLPSEQCDDSLDIGSPIKKEDLVDFSNSIKEYYSSGHEEIPDINVGYPDDEYVHVFDWEAFGNAIGKKLSELVTGLTYKSSFSSDLKNISMKVSIGSWWRIFMFDVCNVGELESNHLRYLYGGIVSLNASVMWFLGELYSDEDMKVATHISDDIEDN